MTGCLDGPCLCEGDDVIVGLRRALLLALVLTIPACLPCPARNLRMCGDVPTSGQVVKPASLKAMQDWNPMTNGFEACRTTDTEGCLLYGLGLMELPMLYPAAGPCPVSDPACVCAPAVDNAAPVCEVRIAMLGHLGEDWGSSMQLAGMLPRFNVSVALGSNGASGMNYSLPVRENVGANDVAICMMLSAIATELEPTFPKFSCTTEGANRAGAGTASLRPGRAGRPALHTLDTRWQARDPLL